MDDGEVELSDRVLLPQQPDPSTNFSTSASVDSFLDDLLLKNNTTCTHTHTCNPPGPDSSGHTHTCYHTHTLVLASEEDDSRENSTVKRSKRPLGNREAVRKYREKKKAHTAYLEEEVKKLQAINQRLLKKLQGQAGLEAEVLRLKCLLLDLRGKIDNELGVFPFQKPCSSINMLKESDCRVSCETGLACFHTDAGVSSQAQVILDCGVKVGGNSNCVSPNGHVMDRVDTMVSSAAHPD